MSSTAHAPLPHTTNSDSTSNGKVQAAAGHRIKMGGLNLPANQAISIPANMKHELLVIPSSSMPSWGGFFTIDIREKNVVLNNITLQFTTSAITGTSIVGYLNPAYFFFTRIEIVQGGNVIDTIYGNQQFLLNNMLEWDEDRLAIMAQSGHYSSSTQRTLLSSGSAPNVSYVNLRSYFDESKISLLTSAHDVQLRVYMDTFLNAFTLTSGTSPVSTMMSCNAYCKVSRIDPISSVQRIQDMTVSPHHSIFHDLHYGTFTVASGTTSSTIILAPIVGNVAMLFFTIRSSVVGTGCWNYTQLSSWALLDSASTNIVGGQNIPAGLSANHLNKDWCKSSYNTETSFGLTDNKANYYCWSFSADPVAALSQGQALTSRKFFGQEQLVLQFPSALGAQVVVDVYAMVESVLEQTPTSVKKIAM